MAWWKICLVTGGYVLLVILRRIKRQRRLCKSSENMMGQTVVITGASSGIGEATALEMAKRHARVVLACRDLNAAEETTKYIRQYTRNGELVAMKLDLASLSSVREFCRSVLAQEPHIDILVNNAGVYQPPYTKTEDGFEMQLGVNHFGHFLLTTLLLERIKHSAPSRIIIVSSSLHKHGVINFVDINSEKHYDRKQSYCNSKLANALFARELSFRLNGSGVTVYCIHPGMVATKLARYVMNRFVSKLIIPLAVLLGLQTSEEGCQTIIYCAVASELAGVTDGYYGSCLAEPWSEAASDLGVSKKLWELSEDLTGLKGESGDQ